MWIETLGTNTLINLNTLTKLDIALVNGKYRVRGIAGSDTHGVAEFSTEAEAQFWMHAAALQLGLVHSTRGGIEPG